LSKLPRRALVRAGLILMFAAAMAGCPKNDNPLKNVISPPTVTVSDVSISNISREQVRFLVKLDVANPNPVGLTLAKVEYNFELAGRPLAAGTTEAPLAIKASGSTPAEVPVALAYNELKTIYDQNKDADYLEYKLTGMFHVATPIGNLPVPYRQTGKVPVVRPPQVLGVSLKVKQLSLTGAEVALVLQLMNPNGYPLEIKKLTYALALEGKPFASGEVAAQKVGPKLPGLIEVPLKIDFASGFAWAGALLASRHAAYALDYQAVYVIDKRPVEQKEYSQGAIDFGP
jgi:LEA14-like dessication related protein